MKPELIFIVRTSIVYCALSVGFSFVGIFLAQKGPLQNPLPGFTLHEVAGHFLWGLVLGAITLSLRYTIIAGAFAVLIDSDHLIGLTHLDALGRMSHSIAFGAIALVSLSLLGKKDWLLGAIAFTSVLSHTSFDIFDGDPNFPIFVPFYNQQISFGYQDWILFEAIAIVIVGVTSVLVRRDRLQKLARN